MKRIRGLTLIAAFGAAILLASCGEKGASDSDVVATPTPSLTVRNDRLFIPVRINGVDVEALLDSGAEVTFMDTAYAAEIGLATIGSDTARGTGGETEVTFAENVTIEAVGVTLEERTVAILDLSDIAARLVGSPLHVIVGRELFDAARLEIDIENSAIRTVERNQTPPGVRLDMQTHRGLQTIPVSLEGAAHVQADFDLGNANEVLVGAAYAEGAGLSAPDRIIGQKPGGGVGGEVMRDLVELSKLEVAGITFYDVGAAVDRTDTAADANIGVPILKNFLMTVDYSENALWLEAR